MRRAMICLVLAAMISIASSARGQEEKPAAKPLPKPGPLIAYQLTIVNVTAAPDDDSDQTTHVDLARVLAKWEQQGRVQWQKTLLLSAVENQAAHVQFGEQKPIVTGSQELPGGRRARNVTMQNAGLTFGVTGVVEDEGTILFEADVEHSYFTAHNAAKSDDESALPGKLTEQHQVQTTARCHPAKACLIGGIKNDTPEDKSQTLLFVSAEVVK